LGEGEWLSRITLGADRYNELPGRTEHHAMIPARCRSKDEVIDGQVVLRNSGTCHKLIRVAVASV
jgi:hypothetical protein